MCFQIGDKVIHETYGLGEVIRIEEKDIHDQVTNCYVVLAANLTIWVPVNNEAQHSLRRPATPAEFTKLFDVLSGPGESLPEDRMQRRNQLTAQMKTGELGEICRLLRDLTHYQQAARLNDHDRAILERASRSLLTEWTYALDVPINQAQQALAGLLGK